MQPLNPQEREYVVKASMLLRLARAANLGRSRRSREIPRQRSHGAVKMTLQSRRRAGWISELWAIEKDRAYFREVFGARSRLPRRKVRKFAG